MKQANAELKKLIVYAIDQAPAIILPQPYVYVAWWPWVKNYYGEIRVGQPTIRSDPRPHLDRSGNEEKDGILILVRNIGYPLQVLWDYEEARNRYPFLLIESDLIFNVKLKKGKRL